MNSYTRKLAWIAVTLLALAPLRLRFFEFERWPQHG